MLNHILKSGSYGLLYKLDLEANSASEVLYSRLDLHEETSGNGKDGEETGSSLARCL